jgi:hypothetical protein
MTDIGEGVFGKRKRLLKTELDEKRCEFAGRELNAP